MSATGCAEHEIESQHLKNIDSTFIGVPSRQKSMPIRGFVPSFLKLISKG
jgi:hypothetical protein